MPPKRKPAAAPKRVTRRTDAKAATRKPNGPSSSVTPPSTNPGPRVVRTYGRASRRQSGPSAPAKEESEESEEVPESESDSEDELLISPKKPTRAERSPSPPKTRPGRPPATSKARRSQLPAKARKSFITNATPQRVTRSRHVPEPSPQRSPSPPPTTPKRRGRPPGKKVERPPSPSPSPLTDDLPSPAPQKVISIPRKRTVEVVIPPLPPRTLRTDAKPEPPAATSEADANEEEQAVEPPRKKRKVIARRSPSPIAEPVTVTPTPPVSPTKKRSSAFPTSTPTSSPTKRSPTKRNAQPSPTRTRARIIPAHLHECFDDQKRAILRALNDSSSIRTLQEDRTEDDQEPTTNQRARQQIADLLEGTITRSEGNSCLILGARGSGKSQIVDECLSRHLSPSNKDQAPIVIRLSGWIHQNDRLAIREIAHQLYMQTGASYLADELGVEAEDDDAVDEADEKEAVSSFTLPSATHLPMLISLLPTLSRPTVVLLDAFDLMALHPRQALLYCLLDTVQSCRAESGKGLAVLGMTSRVDTINLLEKRVKSRFSGRIIWTSPPARLDYWTTTVQNLLTTQPASISDEGKGREDNEDLFSEDDAKGEWRELWEEGVTSFLEDRYTRRLLEETFDISRDYRVFTRIMFSLALNLSVTDAFPTAAKLERAAEAQRARPQYPYLLSLPYPSLCLLIASVHASTAGYPHFTFEMLHDFTRTQIRASAAAPVLVNGGSIGMVKCSRSVLEAAFETLVAVRIFIAAVAPSANVAKEFVKYRMVPTREEVKAAVTKTGQVNLNKWLNKATNTK